MLWNNSSWITDKTQTLTFSGILFPQMCNKWIARLGEDRSNSLINGVLVLVKPVVDVVANSASVMVDLKVVVDLFLSTDLWFSKLHRFAVMGRVQLGQQSLVSGFRHNAFFLKNGKNTSALRVIYCRN